MISDMNPQTPSAPQPSGEQPAPMSPEQAALAGAEQLPPAPGEMVAPAPVPADANAAQAAAPPPALTASDVAAAIAKMPGADGPPPVAVANPAAAADQDVIETEWVDQAEATIAKTAGDPHAEEEAVEALQVDYLAKRYGHAVKKPDDPA